MYWRRGTLHVAVALLLSYPCAWSLTALHRAIDATLYDAAPMSVADGLIGALEQLPMNERFVPLYIERDLVTKRVVDASLLNITEFSVVNTELFRAYKTKSEAFSQYIIFYCLLLLAIVMISKKKVITLHAPQNHSTHFMLKNIVHPDDHDSYIGADVLVSYGSKLIQIGSVNWNFKKVSLLRVQAPFHWNDEQKEVFEQLFTKQRTFHSRWAGSRIVILTLLDDDSGSRMNTCDLGSRFVSLMTSEQ